MTEVFRERREDQACRERRVLLASPESDFQGLPAPKVTLRTNPALSGAAALPTAHTGPAVGTEGRGLSVPSP